MNDLRFLCVQIIERVEQLIRPRQHLVGGKRTSFTRHHLRQVVAGDVLHHEKLPVGFGKMVADARQRGMMQTCEQPRFAFELFAQTFVGKERLFQRDGGIETLIDGFIDGAHAALAELAHDPIPALEDCVWRQHRPRLYTSRVIRVYLWQDTRVSKIPRDAKVIDVGPPSRRRWKIWIIVAAIVLLLSFSRLLSIYLSALWFDSLGYSSVYWYIFKLK